MQRCPTTVRLLSAVWRKSVKSQHCEVCHISLYNLALNSPNSRYHGNMEWNLWPLTFGQQSWSGQLSWQTVVWAAVYCQGSCRDSSPVARSLSGQLSAAVYFWLGNVDCAIPKRGPAKTPKKYASNRCCCVPQCIYRRPIASTGLPPSLHTFPLAKTLREQWKVVLRIGKPITSYMFVCSQHFVDSDFHYSKYICVVECREYVQ
jgi:hypothetical protein